MKGEATNRVASFISASFLLNAWQPTPTNMATEADVKTEKVFDLNKGEFIDKPIEGIQGQNPKMPIYPTPEEIAAKEAAAKNNPPDPEPGKTEQQIADEKAAAAAEAAKKAADEAAAKAAQQPIFEPNDYIKTKFNEKYGVESESDLDEILQSTSEVVTKYQELEAKYQELEKKAAEPRYRTEQEQKIAEFLSSYDPDKFGEGLSTIGSILAMDPANVSGRTALEEAFIISHPNLSRDEAKELFSEEFSTKYQVDRNNFDSDEAFARAKKLADIKMKDAESEARKVLLAKKEELKAKPPTSAPETKKDQPPANKPAEIPAETVKQYTDAVQKFFNPAPGQTFNQFQYVSDDGKDVLHTLVLDAEKQKDIQEFVMNYVKRPEFYDKSGKIPNFDPQEIAKTGLRMLHGDWMEDQLWAAVKTVAAKLRAEQIAGTKPDKESKGGGDVKLSVDDQFAELARKQKEARRR